MVVQVKYFNFLAKKAQQVEPVRRARLAACLVYKNEIISFGYNQKKSHPFQKQYGKSEEAIFLHAEIAAIVGALKNHDLETIKKSSMYVLRLKKVGKSPIMVQGLARPCIGCQRALAQFDIREVYYTTDQIDCYQCL
jgi:deoxycytidylate deaminase